ncbi:MAG: hypothetical protein AAGG00_00495 [Cyanobacteria bacterium P01_H01_bin.150]
MIRLNLKGKNIKAKEEGRRKKEEGYYSRSQVPPGNALIKALPLV